MGERAFQVEILQTHRHSARLTGRRELELGRQMTDTLAGFSHLALFVPNANPLGEFDDVQTANWFDFSCNRNDMPWNQCE